MGYQITNDFAMPNMDPQQYSYAPVFYSQDMFSDQEKQMQGYQQPYFAN